MRTSAGKTPETGAQPCGRKRVRLPQASGQGAIPSEGIKGDEWAA
jgi:hypothetical protein